MTGQFGVVNTLGLCLGGAGTPSVLTEVFVVFLSAPQENSGMVPRLDHGHFYPYSFQFVIHQPYHFMLYNLDIDSFVK
jgi:hypothetical protein